MKHSRVRFGEGAEEARTEQKLCRKCCFNGVLLWKAATNVLHFKELTLTICGRRYLLDSSTLTYSLQKSFSSRDVGYMDRIKQSCWVICQQQDGGGRGGGGLEREVALSQCDKIPWLSWNFTATIPVFMCYYPIPGWQKQGFHPCEEKIFELKNSGCKADQTSA